MLDLDKELGLAPPTSAAVKPPSAFDLDKELGIGAPVEVGGLRAAAKQMVGQTIKGAGQAAADFIPGVTEDNGLRRYGQGVIEANPTKVQSLGDIVESPGTTIAEAVGNATPSMAATWGLRTLGAGLTATGLGAPLGLAVGVGGPTLLAALPSYAAIRDAQKEGGADQNTFADKAIAGVSSLGIGAIEQFTGPQKLVVDAMTKGLKREAGERLAKAVGKTALKSGAEEAGEELVQNPIEQLASYQDPTTAKNIEETLFGGAMGFIGGGVLGGGMQAVGGQKDLDEKDPVKETTEAVQARTLSEIVGVPATTVKNGQAYISVGEGEFVTAPIAKVTEHFLNGGTLENFDTAMATKDSLDKLAAELDSDRPAVDLAYLTILRNVDQGLIQAGVNRKDIDALILSRVQDTPGRKEYIAQLLASGRPDPTAIKEIATGEIDTPGAPLQAEWNRQQEVAAATNRRTLQRLQETEQRIKSEQELISHWQSIGAVETPEEGQAKLKEWEDRINGGQPTAPTESYEQNLQVPGQGQLPGDQGQSAAMGREGAAIPQVEAGAPELAASSQEVIQPATPAGTPPSEMASPSISAQPSPAGVAPQQEDVASWKRSLPPEQLAEVEEYEDLRYKSTALQGPEKGYKPYKLTKAQKDRLAVLEQKYASNYLTSAAASVAAPQQQGETETLNALAPWDVGPVQPREAVDAVVQATAPDVRYDGATLDLHGFTITLPDGRQPSFSIKGEVTPKTLNKAVNEVKGRFETLGLYISEIPGLNYEEMTGTRKEIAAAVRAAAKKLGLIQRRVKTDRGTTLVYEIDDSTSTIDKTRVVEGSQVLLKSLLDHNQLFSLAPELKEIVVIFADSKTIREKVLSSGVGIPINAGPQYTILGGQSGNTIYINPKGIDTFSKKKDFISLESVLLHEVQHALTGDRENVAVSTQERANLTMAERKDNAPAVMFNLSTRRDFLKRGGALVAWAAAGGDVTQLMASSNDFASQASAKDQTVAGLLKWVQANSGSGKFQTLAKDLLALIPNNRAIILNTAETNSGIMGTATVDRKGRTITISLNGGKLEEATFLHEAIHAAVMARYDSLSNYLANKGSLSGKNADPVLQRYQQVWGEFRDAVKAYAKEQGQPISALPTWLREPFTKPDEFMTYALTDENLQEFLASRTYEGKTLWAKLKDFIRALIIKATNGEPTWLDAALMSSNDVLQAMRQDPANFDAASQVLALSAQGSLQSLDTETLFALAPAQNTVTQKIKTFAADKTLDNAPRWLSVAPLHTLVQTLGKQIPQIRKLALHLEESEYISNDLINQAYDYYKKVGAFGTKITDAINRAAATASFYRVNPMEPMLDQEWVPEDKATKAEKLQVAQERWAAAGMERSTGKSFIAAYTEARAAYTAIGNKDAKDMYGAMVNFMRTVREREKNNLLAYIERSTAGKQEAKDAVRTFVGTALPKEQLDAALRGEKVAYDVLANYLKNTTKDKAVLKAAVDAKDNLSLRDQLMQRFNATFKNIAGAYWPLNRVGDFRMEFTDLDGTRVVKHYESASALRADKEMYIKNGVERSSFLEDYKDRRPRGEVAIPMELMQQLSASVYNQKMSEADPSNPNAITEAQTEAQEIVDEMNQIWLRWQPETSALKNSVQRKNVKGFDENMMLSFLDYTRKHAANIAWSEQGRKIEGTIKSLADEITAQRKEGQDVTFKGTVLVDLRKRLQAIRDAKAGPIASTIGKLGTAYYMTSPSIALVQMTQLPILTFPKLATKYGSVGKAATAMLRGVQTAFSKDFTKKAIFGDIAVNTLHDQLRETVNEDNRSIPEAKDKMLGDRLYDDAYIEREFKRLTPKQQKLFVLREALARNLLDISAAHEAYALTQGKNPNGAINRAFNFAMQPMKLSEMASRKAAILATMELAQGEKKTFKGIMNNVSEVVNDTLYSYSKANKPAVLQGGAARVLMMFQWYRIMTALRIGLLFKRSIAAESPEVKAAARKEFVGIMGMTTLLAGTMGLPLAKMVFAALDALADDDEPRDSELEFRNWAVERLGPQWGEVFTHGLPTLAGVDISKRIGLGDLYGAQSEPPPRLHGGELAMWWAANQLGPAFGIVQGGFQGYDLMSRGEYLKGLKASMPKPLRDGLKAARTFEEGDVKTLTGRRILGAEEITADAVPLMALGFNPSEVAQATKNNMSKARLSTAISERRGSVIDAMVKAIQGEGDLDKARAMLIGYNKKMPRFAVSGGDIRSALVRGIKEDLGINSQRDRLIELQYGF